MTNRETYINTPFLRKLNHILIDPEFHEVIRWDESGTMIDIFDQGRIEKEILPRYFRHSKFESFVRQLNLYGFRKMKKKNCHRFRHPDLVKGSSLFSIKSKRKFKNSLPRQSTDPNQPQNVANSVSEEPSVQSEMRSSFPKQQQNKNNPQGSTKMVNNSFNLVQIPFGYNTMVQNPMHMSMINAYSAVNQAQTNFGQLLFFPSVNNLLFYN